MATGKIKISQLTELVSASLNTTLVGVDNGVTYKMELDTLADAITSIVNTSDRSRISALEAETGSYLTSLPNGLVSQSTDLSSLNTFTESIDSRIDSLEAVTSSYLTSLDGAISGAGQISDLGFVTGSYTTINSFNSLTQSFNSISQSFTTISGSVGTIDFSGINAVTASYLAFTQSFNTYTASISTASLVTSISNLNTFTASQSTSSLVDRLNTIESVSGSWITESETGSFLTNLNGAISSSSQLTSSFDTRYTLSGSVQPLPDGLISGSSQLTSSTLAITGSNIFRGDQTISGSLSVTGSITSKGNATIGTGSGDEGGEINLALAQTNTTLTGSVNIDVYQNRLRFWEGGGTNRGAYLNVASQSSTVGSSIVTSPNLLTMQTITSASYAALTPVSGTLYIIIG